MDRRVVVQHLLVQTIVISIAAAKSEGSAQSPQPSASPVLSSPVIRKEGSGAPSSLPNANDSFETVRHTHKVYVDKTPILAKLLDQEATSFYFTRPRKFGKTMFLRMVQKFFLGEAHLFENLKIHGRGNAIVDDGRGSGKWIKHPVVYLDFSNSSDYRSVSSLEDFSRKLRDDLNHVATAYGLRTTKSVKMTSLIRELHQQLRLPVIVLIDDYDAPIHRALLANNSELAKGMHSIFLSIFAAIKAARLIDEVELAFVTGTSRITLYTISSGANNFVDLTDNEEFATALGFTAQEVGTYFQPHIDKLAKSKNTTREQIMKELLEWYGGYRFSSDEKSVVLNPISTIECLRNERFDGFWCATNSIHHVLDTFVTNKIAIDRFENMRVKRWQLLDMYEAEPEEPPFYVYLLCTGFLTIKRYIEEQDICLLGYPNREIKVFLSDRLSSYVASENKSVAEMVEWNEALSKALRGQQIRAAMETLKLYGFPILYSKRGRSSVQDWGATLRLLRIFDAASIKYRQNTLVTVENGTENEVQWLVDVQTLELPVNYVIKTICQKGAVEVMLEFISCVRNGLNSFNEAIGNQAEVYLVGMGFTNRSRGELEDWICLPYRHGALKFDQVQASSQDLVDRLGAYSTRKNVSSSQV